MDYTWMFLLYQLAIILMVVLLPLLIIKSVVSVLFKSFKGIWKP